MAAIFHVGSNTCGIIGLHYNQGIYNAKIEDLDQQLANLKYRYQFAVTANKWQKQAREVLEKQNFRKVISFKSSHTAWGGTKRETLTLWVKILDNFDESLSKKPIKQIPNSNCSINFGRKGMKQFKIFVQKEKESFAKLKLFGYRRVKNTPIWFKISKKATVLSKKEREEKEKQKEVRANKLKENEELIKNTGKFNKFIQNLLEKK